MIGNKIASATLGIVALLTWLPMKDTRPALAADAVSVNIRTQAEQQNFATAGSDCARLASTYLECIGPEHWVVPTPRQEAEVKAQRPLLPPSAVSPTASKNHPAEAHSSTD
jgi:hypothetical protein